MGDAMIHLSHYQWRILTAIQRYIAQHGMSPSIRDISAGAGISSTAVVHHHLNILEGDGLISRQQGIDRTIVLHTGKVGFQP